MIPLLSTIVDFALPPRCAGCGTIVDADHRFCVTCWGRLDLLSGEGCALCNLPMAHGPGSICAPCMARPPRHDGVHAAVAYGEIARGLALRLKYGRQTGIARTMARLIVPRMPDGDVVVPVPLHRWRLWGRGFNQSSLIATAIGRLSGKPVDHAFLTRVRPTRPLRGMSPKARADAVRGAFRAAGRIDDCHVLLVDDVFTSGATANACAMVLKRAGAARVSIVCWARVLRQD